MEYGFWFWNHKLAGILAMFAELSDYELDEIEIEIIKKGLIGTNDELNQWANYQFNGKKFKMDFQFAYDGEEHPEIVHIRIKTDSSLKEKIEALNLFQGIFLKLELEN